MLTKYIDQRVQSHLETINEQLEKITKRLNRDLSDRISSFTTDQISRDNDFHDKFKKSLQTKESEQLDVMKRQNEILDRIADILATR